MHIVVARFWPAAAALAFGLFIGGAARSLPPLQAAGPKHVSVPKSWGAFRAVYHDQLLFEDERGTIRSVFPNGSVVVFTVSRR